MVELAQKRERIIERLIEDEMRESFLDYSMSVIVQRALPDVRDGLKPVHRRILYAMHEQGLRPDRPYKKSASVVGEVLGKFHPHGDTAVYDTLVRMVQDFSLRYPLIDGQGNFGSIDGDNAAAYRYTEARLAPPAVEILDELERDTVDFGPNFDGRLKEPLVLPGRLPNLLVNGASGIAVGMSTNIPPHNLPEVAAAIHLLVEDPECTLDDLMEVLPGPDFPTAGFIVGTEGIREMYETGRGRMTMRGRIVREKIRGGKSQLIVTEIPYTVSKVKVIEQITDLANAGKLDEASDIRDESDRDGMRLVIELKRGADVARALKVLYKRTYLQYTFGGILIALDHGQPKELALKEILEAYRDHRVEVIQRRSRHDLEEAKDERHVLEGLLVALDAIDEVIRLIRESKDPDEAGERLRERFELSERQSDAILSMRLVKLTALQTEELRTRMEELEETIAELEGLLDSEDRQLDVLLEELDEVVEKYGDARRTEIIEDEPEEIDLEQVAAEEDVVVTLSHEGYVKRIPMHLYRRRRKKGKQLAAMERYEEDYLERVFVVTTSDTLLVFTGEGQCHFLPVLDVPESSRSSRGQNLSTVLGISREDRVVAMVPAEDLEADRHLLFLTEGGTVKRSELVEYSNPRAGGIIAIGLKEGDRLFDVTMADVTEDVMIITRLGRAIRFPAEEVTVVGRTAQGVRGVKLEEGDEVVGMILVRRDASVLVVTENGFGKQVPVGEYPIQHRDGLGNLTVDGAEKEGELVCGLELVPGDEVMIITAAGRTVRIPAGEIPTKGRRNVGRALIDVAGGDRVVEVTRVLGGPGREEEPDDETVDETVEEGLDEEGQLHLMGEGEGG